MTINAFVVLCGYSKKSIRQCMGTFVIMDEGVHESPISTLLSFVKLYRGKSFIFFWNSSTAYEGMLVLLPCTRTTPSIQGCIAQK